MPSVQKISPCLWFDRNAEEAVNHYVSIFDNARILSVTRYGDSGPLPKGTVLVIVFELAGQRFMALNGGPMFRFSEAISMVVRCDTQDEINMFWEKLSAGGEKSCCGWLKDKFGLSWQVVPSMLDELMQDPARANRVMAAVMGMKKLDIETMTRAAA
jgi:predicted 3-demethylubiquinone-9 3-methyltransferase (glyoxalase superfamily)